MGTPPDDRLFARAAGIPWRWIALLMIALTVLLAVVGIASRGTRSGGGGQSSSKSDFPAYVLDTLMTIYLIGMVAGLGLLVYGLWLRREAPRKQPSDTRRLVRLLLFAVAFSIAGLALAERLANRDGEEGSAVPTSATVTAPAEGEGVEREYVPRWRWVPAIAAMVIGAGALGVLLVRRRRQRRPSRLRAAAVALSEVLQDTLDDLRAEKDPRKAVIAAYARMERTLAASGIPRTPSEAPLEYLSRILLELRVRAAAVLELTDLFERAKFSRHDIDGSMKENAIQALVSIRDDLRVVA